MPRFVVPKKSGAHREAAIALYRALLSQCSSVPLPPGDLTLLRNITRNKFRRNRELHSTRLLKYAFLAGYETLSLLDNAAAGDSASTSRIAQLLRETPPHMKRPPKKSGPSMVPARRAESCLPPDRKELDARPRPLEQLSGPRRVPRLVSANSIPILRMKKPQPRSLSRIVTDKIKQRQKRLDTIYQLQAEDVELGRWENSWDDLMEEMHGVVDDDIEDDEDTAITDGWEAAGKAAINGIHDHITEAKKAQGKLAKRMLEIVDQEKELAEQEKEARKQARITEKQNRAAETKGPEG